MKRGAASDCWSSLQGFLFFDCCWLYIKSRLHLRDSWEQHFQNTKTRSCLVLEVFLLRKKEKKVKLLSGVPEDGKLWEVGESLRIDSQEHRGRRGGPGPHHKNHHRAVVHRVTSQVGSVEDMWRVFPDVQGEEMQQHLTTPQLWECVCVCVCVHECVCQGTWPYINPPVKVESRMKKRRLAAVLEKKTMKSFGKRETRVWIKVSTHTHTHTRTHTVCGSSHPEGIWACADLVISLRLVHQIQLLQLCKPTCWLCVCARTCVCVCEYLSSTENTGNVRTLEDKRQTVCSVPKSWNSSFSGSGVRVCASDLQKVRESQWGGVKGPIWPNTKWICHTTIYNFKYKRWRWFFIFSSWLAQNYWSGNVWIVYFVRTTCAWRIATSLGISISPWESRDPKEDSWITGVPSGSGLEPVHTLEPVLCIFDSQRTGSSPGDLVPHSVFSVRKVQAVIAGALKEKCCTFILFLWLSDVRSNTHRGRHGRNCSGIGTKRVLKKSPHVEPNSNQNQLMVGFGRRAMWRSLRGFCFRGSFKSCWNSFCPWGEFPFRMLQESLRFQGHWGGPWGSLQVKAGFKYHISRAEAKSSRMTFKNNMP